MIEKQELENNNFLMNNLIKIRNLFDFYFNKCLENYYNNKK